MKVKCIDVSNMGSASGDLVINQVYEVVRKETAGSSVYYLKGVKFPWMIERFVEVNDLALLPDTVWHTTLKEAIKNPPTPADKEEQRLRRALRFKAGPNECDSCGSPLPCRFHP